MNKIIINPSNKQQDLLRQRDVNTGRPWYKYALELLSNFPSNTYPKLVDVGGGAGEFTEMARALNYETTLLDGNEISVQNEMRKGHKAYHLDLNYPLELVKSDSMDIAVSLEVIEHIVSAENLIAEVYRILRPGGIYIISTPNFSFYGDRIRYLLGENVYGEGYHFRFYTKKSLEKIFRNAGFEIECRNSIAKLIGIRRIVRIISFGAIILAKFRAPAALESILARTFVIGFRKPL